MVFDKQICILIYVNRNNGEKINCLKTNLNIKNVNKKQINTKKLTVRSRKTLPPGNQEKKPRTSPGIYC